MRKRIKIYDNISNINVFLDKVLDDSGRKSIVFEPLQSRVNEVVTHCIENFGPEKCFWGSGTAKLSNLKVLLINNCRLASFAALL